jgi:hypothetical protein
MRSSWQRVAVAVALATAVAGCSEKTTGNASAGTPSSSSEKASGSAKPTSSSKPAVNRPKSIDLMGVDPCSLLTDVQRQQLGLTRDPRKSPSSAYPGTTMCGMSPGDFKFSASILALVTEGIQRYVDNPKLNASPVVIGGFPAQLATFKDLHDTCFLGIDVADGQMVDLQMGSSEGVPEDQLCQKVQAMGEAVITTLSSR